MKVFNCLFFYLQTFHYSDHNANGIYVIKDKYWGRNIQFNEFLNQLQSFFYNGKTIRTDVIKTLIDEAKKLRNCVVKVLIYTFII